MDKLKTQAPKSITVLISLVLIALGLFGAMVSPQIADNGDWFLLLGYLLLLAGVFVKGL